MKVFMAKDGERGYLERLKDSVHAPSGRAVHTENYVVLAGPGIPALDLPGPVHLCVRDGNTVRLLTTQERDSIEAQRTKERAAAEAAAAAEEALLDAAEQPGATLEQVQEALKILRRRRGI